MLKDKLQADLKKAMLARESDLVEVIKGLKSAILYEEVALKKREEGLSEEEALTVLRRESKKRQDSIELYRQGGNTAQADKELSEKQIIDAYLPAQISEDKINEIIDAVLVKMSISELTKQDMGKVIGAVKAEAGPNADGSTVARLVQLRVGA